MQTLDEVLEHYGIMGMKWGVRRDRATLDRKAGRTSKKKAAKTDVKKKSSPKVSADAKKAADVSKKVKKGNVSALTNTELQQLNTRLQLEQSYSRLAQSPNNKLVSGGSKFAKELVIGVGKQQATRLANEQAVKLIAKGIKIKR